MHNRVTKKYVSFALVTLIAQAQSAYGAIMPSADRLNAPTRDNNLTNRTRENKSIIVPHTNIGPLERGESEDRIEDPDAQHVMFTGDADEPVAVEKETAHSKAAKSVGAYPTAVNSAGGKSARDKSAVKTVKGTTPTPATKEQLESTIKTNWATWTAKTDGKLQLGDIAAILYNQMNTLDTTQVDALVALASGVERMMAKDYADNKLPSGRLYLVQGKDGGIRAEDGVKGQGKNVNLNVAAKYDSTKDTFAEGCNAAFKVELLQNWSTWTASTNGVMTFAQLNKLLTQTDPPIDGPAAAALGAIGSQMNNMQQTADNKEANAPLVSLQLAVQNGKLTLTSNGQSIYAGGAAWNYYAPGVAIVAQDSKEPGQITHKENNMSLYGPTGDVVLNDVRQTDFGNCFFLSCVWGAMHTFGTSYVQNMIKQVGPYQFQVSFPGYTHNPVTVTVTPAEVAMFSRTTNGGCYLAVLGLAADQITTNSATGTTATDDRLTPLWAMVNGGWDLRYLNLMTGQKYESVGTCSSTSSKYSSFESALQTAMNSKLPVNIATSDHYMTISAFSDSLSGMQNYVGPADAKGPFVTIHNQWGNTGDYSTKTGTTVHMVNGYFTLPVADLATYGLVSIQVPTGEAKVDGPTIATGGEAHAPGLGVGKAGNGDEGHVTDKAAVGTATTDKEAAKTVRSTTAVTPATAKELEATIKENWATWTSKTDGKLPVGDIAAILYNQQNTIYSTQVDALVALASTVERMMAQDYGDNKLPSGRLYLVQDKNGGISLEDGAKGQTRTLNLTAAAKQDSTTDTMGQGCNAILNIELMQNWKTWTASTNGVMTFAQLNKLCKQTNPPITGPAAAALAAIGNQLNNMQVAADNKDATAALASLQLSVNNGQLTVTSNGQDINMGNAAWYYFAPAVPMVAQDTKEPTGTTHNQKNMSLYGPTGSLVINDVRQADYNDCFFLACVWSAMHTFGPSYVQDMIKQVGPDKFDVSFPGYAHNPVEVTITPTEAAMFSGTTNGGCYLAVLAMAADRITTNSATGQSKTDDRLTPLWAMVNCGLDIRYLQLMTGQDYKSINTCSSTSSDYNSFSSALQAAMNSGQPVNVETHDHYMTVSAYSDSLKGMKNYVGPADAKGPFITIHNQWGNTGDYTIKGGSTVKMVNGYFTLPVADLASYGLIAIQVATGEAKVDTPVVAAGGKAVSTPKNLKGTQPIGSAVKVNTQSGMKQFSMVNGTAFVAHHDPVAVNIPGGLVKIASGSAAYISRHANATAIFNLDDQGSIVVSAGGNDRSVPAGQALIVCTDQSAEFGTINPCRTIINPTTVKLLDSSSAVRTFAASYSPLAVLDDSAQFAQLAKSNQPSDRALTNRILKTAAALSQMSP